jgi:hypothetical protein
MFTSENNPGRNDKRANEAVRLYNSGLSFTQIAKMIGGTRQSIYDMCRLRPEYKPRKTLPADCQYFNGVKYTKRATGYFMRSHGKRTLMHRDVWEHHNGKIPENFDIHHIDHDRSNNRIENLQALPRDEHARRYASGHNQHSKKVTA